MTVLQQQHHGMLEIILWLLVLMGQPQTFSGPQSEISGHMDAGYAKSSKWA